MRDLAITARAMFEYLEKIDSVGAIDEFRVKFAGNLRPLDEMLDIWAKSITPHLAPDELHTFYKKRPVT